MTIGSTRVAEINKNRYYDRLPILIIEGATMIFLHDISVSMERHLNKNINFVKRKCHVKKFIILKLKEV